MDDVSQARVYLNGNSEKVEVEYQKYLWQLASHTTKIHSCATFNSFYPVIDPLIWLLVNNSCIKNEQEG